MASKTGTAVYTISDDFLFDLASMKVNSKQTLDGGVTVEAHVENGKIVGYTAHDASGKPLKVRRLRVTDVPGDAFNADGTACYFCICTNGNCRCWPEVCPSPA